MSIETVHTISEALAAAFFIGAYLCAMSYVLGLPKRIRAARTIVRLLEDTQHNFQLNNEGESK